MSTNDPAKLTPQLKVAAGHRAPNTQLPDWVLLSGTNPEVRTLNRALSAHTTIRGTHEQAGPSVRTLAHLLGLRKTDSVARFMLQLEVIGAVDVVRPTRTLDRHTRYVVLPGVDA